MARPPIAADFYARDKGVLVTVGTQFDQGLDLS